jgi:hypothetical protein
MWWLENRIHVEVFAGEIEDAVRILRVLPGAGTPYPAAGLSGLRRLYLRKIACHLYFTFDEHDVSSARCGVLGDGVLRASAPED